MPTDDLHTLLHDAAAGPVAALDHDELRRRARSRTRSAWAAAGVAVVAALVGVGALVANLTTPPTIDVTEAPGSRLAPNDPLPGLPAFPATLDLPPPGGVAAVHLGERPVVVVHLDTGEVLVLDAISPHLADIERPKVVAFCPEPWVFTSEDGQVSVTTPGVLRDVLHGSLFAADGAYLAGPASTGLLTYEVRSVGSDTVDVGPPGRAPAREVGPFADLLGHSDGVGRPVATGANNCLGVDATDLVQHRAEHPDLWLYAVDATGASPSDTDHLEPLVEGERTSTDQPTAGAPVAAVLIILAFVVAVLAFGTYLRRREADGSLDPGPSSASRPGLRRLFDFGPGGWSEDGRNQPPRD